LAGKLEVGIAYVNIFLRTVKGRGTMRSMNRPISAMRSMKTNV
jgi:hypothetical protein